MSGVPRAVDEAIERWRAGQRQEAIGWSRETWVSWLPQHEELLRELPNPLGRDHVTERFTAIGTEPSPKELAERAFVAAMVWGFGPVGYGAWRTRRILDVNGDAGASLLAIHDATRNGGPKGFRAMASKRLKHLGVAFGTKFLYFSAEATQPLVRAPILDRIVRQWLAENAELTLSVWSWRPQHYELYCGKLAEWGASYDPKLRAGQVEEAIFEDATRGSASKSAMTVDPADLLDQLSALVSGSPRAREEKAAAAEALDALSDFFGEE